MNTIKASCLDRLGFVIPDKSKFIATTAEGMPIHGDDGKGLFFCNNGTNLYFWSNGDGCWKVVHSKDHGHILAEIIYDTEFVPDVGMECELAMEETEFLSLQRGKVITKPAGTRVKVVGHINRIDNNNLCITIMCVDDPSCGFCTGNPEYLVRPIKSEEDKLREWLKGMQPKTDRSDIQAKLNKYAYNLIKAGVKLPEGEQ